MKISVVINTFNSDRFLNQCLRSVEKFDEIVLCDMHSTDGTIAIAEKYGCRIVYHERTGMVEPARNYAIAQAENEWVLVLDSDEVVPDALREYLYRFAETAEQRGYAALKMARKNYFLGRFMHGDYPDYIIRLIRKSKTYWPETIHARPVIDGGGELVRAVGGNWRSSTWPTKASRRGSPRSTSTPIRSCCAAPTSVFRSGRLSRSVPGGSCGSMSSRAVSATGRLVLPMPC